MSDSPNKFAISDAKQNKFQQIQEQWSCFPKFVEKKESGQDDMIIIAEPSERSSDPEQISQTINLQLNKQIQCSSPIQEFRNFDLSNRKFRQEGQSDSPSSIILNSGSFKKIIQKQNEDQQQLQHNQFANESDMLIQEKYQKNNLCDIEGNIICEFSVHPYDNQYISQEIPIVEDKQNDLAFMPIQHLQTPLKNKELRSPLKNITPSMTKRKKKSSALKTISQKSNTYLTPRTMAESRFSGSSGLRRIQRL